MILKMNDNYISVFNPVVCLVINMLSQVLSVRCFPKIGLLKSVFIGFALGSLGLVLSAAFLSPEISLPMRERLADFTVQLITYAAFGYCYFHFLNLGETARRIRILRELSESNGGLTREQLLERYNAGQIIERRLARLLGNGQIILKSGAYYIGSPVVLLMAKSLVFLKFILLGKKSEFDRSGRGSR